MTIPNEQPSPDGMSEGLQLSSRQIAIINLLEKLDTKLVPIYLGALETLQSRPTDFIALAAHGFREVMEKTTYWAGGKKAMGMKEKFNADFDEIWPRVHAETEGGTFTGDPNLIQRFISRFGQFKAWVEETFPSRAKQAEIALRILQKKRNDPSTFLNDRKEWLRIRDNFTQISHHNQDVNEQGLRRLVDILEILLLKYLRPIASEKLKAIEQIATSAGGAPTAQQLTDIKHLIDGWADRDAFLGAVQHPSWLSLLIEDGWFDPASTQGPLPNDPSPGHGEAQFLGHFVDSHPDEVDRAARQLALIGNERVHRYILEIANRLPSALRGGYVEFARQWAVNTNTYTIEKPLEEFISKLLATGLTDQSFELLKVTLQFSSDDRLEEKRSDREAGGAMSLLASLDPEPRWEVHQYKSLIDTIVGDVLLADATTILDLLCKTLSEAIDLSIWPDEKPERSGNDGSTYWRPAIEPHDQNFDYGHKEQLVSGIRDLLERIVASDPSKFVEVESLLAKHRWLIFSRLRLHIYRLFPDLGSEGIRSSILDPHLRDSDAWHEWALLLRQEFNHLGDPERTSVFDWIETGFDPTGRIELFQQKNESRLPDDELIQRWKRHWQFRRLSLIADHLPPAYRKVYEEMRSEFGEAEHPDFHHWNIGGGEVEQRSPISLKDVLSISVDDLVEQLNDWHQDGPFEEPSESGLLGTMRAAARQRPSHFIPSLFKYRVLDASRYIAILEGCLRSGVEGGEVDWPQLLKETEISIRKVILPTANAASEIEGDQNIGIEIIRALENAMTEEKSDLPIECRDAIWECIRLLLDHPSPSSDNGGKESPHDLSSIFLNTARLISMRSIFSYANWVRKLLHARSDENPATEILEALDDRLVNEKTLAGAGVFGERLSWLIHFHREWVAKRLPRIFPSCAEKAPKRKAVWNCFITMTWPSVAGLELLQSEYALAVEACTIELEHTDSSREEMSPARSLVHHLCEFYLWGKMPLSEPTLSRFYEVASIRLRQHLLSHIGRRLRSAKGPITEDVSQRLREIIECRIERLSEADVLPNEREELFGYFRWLDAQKMPPEWSMQTLLRILDLAPRRDARHDYFVIGALAAYSADWPALSVQCLHKLIFAERGTPDRWGEEEAIKTILRNGFASGIPSIRSMSAEIQDELLRLGRMQFRNLGEEGSAQSS